MNHPIAARLVQWLGVAGAPVSHTERSLSALGGFIGILATFWVARAFVGDTGAMLVVASMGASAVLLFAAPHGPFSQPWPLAGGHLIAALIGVTCAKTVAEPALAGALAVGLSIGAMHYLRCIHPPGGGTALVAAVGGPQIQSLGYGFVLTPVLENLIVLLVVAIAFNYPLAWRRYPAALKPRLRAPEAEPTSEPAISHADFVYALSEIGSFVDVSEQDLLRIYDIAMHRHTRETLHPRSIRLGHYYSNGKYGDEWEIRRVIDESGDNEPDGGTVIYRVVAGLRRRDSGIATRAEFSRWAAYEVQLNENSWQRIENGD